MTCCSRDNYQDLLSARLKEIEELDFFDNGVVVFTEKSGYGSTFSRGQPDYDFYEDDVVFDSTARFYRALADDKGKPPNSSTKEWGFIYKSTHPYFFLRDTARTDDLKRLLKDKHPYIRTYAFGALAQRDSEGLFKVIMDDLSDTTRIEQMTSDHGFPLCPAELIIWYLRDHMTQEQIRKLKGLNQSDYGHLE